MDRKRKGVTFLGVILRLALLAAALLLWQLFVVGCAPVPEVAPRQKKKPKSTRAVLLEGYRKTLASFSKAGAPPLIDLDVSLDAWKSTARLIEAMDRARVALAAVTSQQERRIREATARHPQRLIPLTTSAGETLWAGASGAYLARIRRQLASGAFGIGMIRMEATSGDKERGRRSREALEKIFLIAHETRAALWLDMPPVDALLGRLERQLRTRPEVRVLWTKAGWIPEPDLLPGYGHSLLRALSLRHPNLFFSLTQRPPEPPSEIPLPRRNHLFDPGPVLSPEWRVLLDSRVAHFMSGSGHQAASPAVYQGHTQSFRENVLGSLTPATRRRISYENAWRLLTGRAWKPEARRAP